MIKLERFDYIVWGVLGLLALAILGVVAAGDRVGAQLTRTRPADGGVVGAYGRVTLEFAQTMEAASVETRFSLEPAVPGVFRWEGARAVFAPSQPFMPGLTYTARLTAGAVSQNGRMAQRDQVWRFTVRAPEIIYLSGVGGGAREVWRLAGAGGVARPLTQTGGMVYDFSVSVDGEQITYSVVNEQRGSDIWVVDREGAAPRKLVDCAADLCTVPAWSPDGARIAFSREPAGLTPGAPNGPPRVWTVSAATGQAAPVYADSQVLGYGPTWSPDGRRLAFFDGANTSIRLLDLESGAEMLVPTRMGTVGSWSPDGRQMVFNDINLDTGQPSVSILVADFETQGIRPLLGDDPNFADFGTPAWSPDGQWLAVSLRTIDSGPSKQIWVMRPDGAEARPITTDTAYTYGGYRWDVWSQALVFQRFELNKPYATPEVAVWRLDTGELTMLALDAATPEWLP